MTPTAAQRLSLTIKRTIRAPRERVFAAFSSIEELKKWFGPTACRVTGGDMTFADGGAYRLDMKTEAGHVELMGIYRKVVPNEHLQLSWQWRGNPEMDFGEMEVDIYFSDTPDGTEITICHRGFATPEVCEGHRRGWEGSFEKLDGVF